MTKSGTKVLLFCDICKRKMHFYAKIGRKRRQIKNKREESLSKKSKNENTASLFMGEIKK